MHQHAIIWIFQLEKLWNSYLELEDGQYVLLFHTDFWQCKWMFHCLIWLYLWCAVLTRTRLWHVVLSPHTYKWMTEHFREQCCDKVQIMNHLQAVNVTTGSYSDDKNFLFLQNLSLWLWSLEVHHWTSAWPTSNRFPSHQPIVFNIIFIFTHIHFAISFSCVNINLY